jgi:hypothetical protein
MKKLLFLFVALILLNNCTINNNIIDERGLFCSSDKDNKYILQLNSNNTFEIEYIGLKVGITHYYCKGEWSYISKKRIIFKCDTITEWDWEKHPYKPQVWNPYFEKEYIKIISKNKVILFQENYKKVILRRDWCNSIPKESLIVVEEKLNVY